MGKNFIKGCMLCLTIAFLVLGFVFRSTADNHKGTFVSTGIMIDGQYSETSSGEIGGDKEQYKTFYSGGTMFYILAGVTGVTWLILNVRKRK